MNRFQQFSRRDRGIALVTMLFLMSLLIILVVAVTLLSRSELRSADVYQNKISAESFSHAATNLVISQIRGATTSAGNAWASQPGAIRRYDAKGKFLAGYKLYSDDDMIIAEEGDFLSDLPDGDWEEKSRHFVDLNEPLISEGEPVFPILDPRAKGTIEGFDFTEELAGTVVADDLSARLPMPTRWIYILRDGTTGHLDPKTDKFVGSRPDGTAIVPDENNPIVGRVAFWTDDESGKININTASEPTFWDTPKSVSKEDLWYARAQPVQGEYQRFPGHPATTALSPVLFGNRVERETLARLDGGEMKEMKRMSRKMTGNRAIKEAIYDLVPRINVGGSESGTKVNDRGSTGIENDGDHLYASLDEFLFKAPRLQKENEDSRETSSVVDRGLLERSRFFITAHSRAPELNLFGLPRISIWPTDSENKKYSYLTGFDKLIRFCSSGPNGEAYYFTRQNADSPTEDWEDIPRNQEVYEYLQELTSENVPGVGMDFDSKWGADRDQILTEVFDYIRSTNLCDDSHPELYYVYDDKFKHTQFTNARVLDIKKGEEVENHYGTHTGHGQVVPIKIDDTMGFGRFATPSEYSLLFICCADPGANEFPQRTGGDRIVDTIVYRRRKNTKIHYTNFPPLDPVPTEEILEKMALGYTPYDKVADKAGKVQSARSMKHPGYDPRNWNHALKVWKNWNKTVPGEEDPIPTNLKPFEKVIQMAFVPEAFIPAQGWSALNSRMRIVTKGLDGLTINGKPLGFAKKIEGNTPGFLGGGYHGRAWGGSAGFRGMTNQNYVSQPLRIHSSDGSMLFNQEKPITIEIYAEHAVKPEQLVQTIELNFPGATFPTPEIQRKGTFHRGGQRDTEAKLWWSFSSPAIQGEINDPINPERNRPWRAWGHALEFGRKVYRRKAKSILIDDPMIGAFVYKGRMSEKNQNPGSPWTDENNNSEDTVTRDPGWRRGPHKGAFWREGDVIRSLVPFHGTDDEEAGGDYRLLAARSSIPETVFRPHPGYFRFASKSHAIDHTLYLPAGAHYYWRFGNADLQETSDGIYPQFDYSVDTQLTDASYHFSKFPDFPRGYAESAGSIVDSRPINTGDFDNGVALTPDGAYINKPDGGNRSDRFGVSRAFHDEATPYFDANWVHGVQGPAYFSPNRQISSPVMFGSLSTGVKREIPWQTLLFRPQPWGHPSDFNRPHPGYEKLKDHYLLDLFWMPVVEPYAISEPFSTAGKINLNYQILPFTNIKRATGLHAVMKAEEMLIISDEDAAHYKNWDHALANYYEPPLPENVHLRQMIDIEETLKQFDDRFLNGEIFRSASEICEVHLVPMRDRSGQTPVELPEPSIDSRIQDQVDTIMKEFWMGHSPTGDNSRERPYSNLYPRLTTKSNTYRIHTRAQAIKKTRGSDPGTFDPELDTTSAEWRGSTLVERYINPNNTKIPDYVAEPEAVGSETLDKFYRFRIIYRKRFDG